MNVRTVCLSQLLNFRFLSLPHAASLLCLCVRTCAFCVCTCYQVNFVLGQAEERGMGDCTPNLAKAVPLYASRCCSKIEKRMQQVLKYYLTQLPLYYSFVCLLSPPPSPPPPPDLILVIHAVLHKPRIVVLNFRWASLPHTVRD